MRKITAIWNDKATATRMPAITVFALLITVRGEAIEVDSVPLKIFTFVGVGTENAMRAQDYNLVIQQSRKFAAYYGFHDLVNLCAAYVFEKRYQKAADVCRRAENYSLSTILGHSFRVRPDSWAAYANHAVVHALQGDFETARLKIADAQRRGGDAGILEHNLIAIEMRATQDTQLSLND